MQFNGNRVVALAAAIMLTGILSWLVYRTDVGRAWRAITQNPQGARTVGINVVKLSHLAWSCAGALAGVAGALLAPLYTVSPMSGDSALAKGFVVVILGGLGSLSGPLIAGLLVGLVEAFGAVYVSAAYNNAYSFLFMVAVMLMLPSGLFSHGVRKL
jgi:branched-chain amino acid transport system permease protein